MPNTYIGVRETGGRFYHQFAFTCACGYEAELGVPVNHHKLIECPECNRLYFRRKPSGMFDKPRLISVVAEGPAA